LLTAACLTAMVLAAWPALLFLANLREYRPPGAPAEAQPPPSVSVLIHARDEEPTIGAAVESALASRGVDLEAIVLDDRSEDATAAIVRAIGARDPRVRLDEALQLPPSWCGKPHACAVLGRLATRPVLVFLDADVRLAPDGLVRMATVLDESGADLVSGLPRQETVGLVEKMVIPLMHFILLGFLPIRRMRSDPAPRLAAGCGQLVITRKTSYEQMGGHAAIRATFHDGIKLPRAYRASGLRTDLFDATDTATCRMYRSASDLWSGLAKNATEGLAAPTLIVPVTLILFGGQVLPWILVPLAPRLSAPERVMAALALVAAYVPRLVAVRRFRQSPLGAVLHPVGILILLAIQWYAFTRRALGYGAIWKGRADRARTGSADAQVERPGG
jgi:hypothetical protein